MAVTKYDAKDCVVVVDGVYITGLGETMVTGEKDEELFATSVGAQGDVVKNVINNPLGKITISPQATSPQRGYLRSLANRTEPFPVWVTNKVLGERFGGTQCSLQAVPSRERGTEAGDMEFVFGVFDYTDEDTL